jgi:hypothetical protein
VTHGAITFTQRSLVAAARSISFAARLPSSTVLEIEP